MLHKEDVGSYFVDNNNVLWQMIGYCPEPTVIMMNMATKEKDFIIPDCPNAEVYHKLVKEDDNYV